MFGKMLVATDLSEASERVVCTLGSLKRLGTREAFLLHCFNIRDVGTLANRLMELARPSFERQKKMLENLGFQVTAKMVPGLPHIEVNRQADEHESSLIVVGSTGATMSGEVLLGSVASAVIHSATRPILILRVKLDDQQPHQLAGERECDLVHHVLFPTDFSDNAEHAFAYLQRIADAGAHRITLLHVQDKSRIDKHLRDQLEKFNEIDTARLQRLKDDLQQRGVKDVRVELPYGSPKKEIIERTRQDDVSLVVMGSQGRGYIAEFFLGSVSHAVTRRSGVPVLLIPAIR